MTTDNVARYSLGPTGAVQNWLACGTVTSPIERLDQIVPPDGSPFGKGGRWILNYWAWSDDFAALKLRVYREMPPSTWTPSARPVLNGHGIAGLPWHYAPTEEDRVVDFSLFNFQPTLMQGWTFAVLDAPEAMTVQAELITIGPARLWLNGTLQTHFAEHFSYVAVQRIPLTLALSRGANEVYLHGEMLAWREARLALGLRFPERPNVTVNLPLGNVDAGKWHAAEDGLSQVLVKQFAFSQLPGELSLDPAAPGPFAFELAISVPLPGNVSKAIQLPILPEGHATQTLSPGERAPLPITPDVMNALTSIPGENDLLLTLRPSDGTPIETHRDLWASTQEFRREPYGDYDARRREALEHLATMPADIFPAMAAVALGKTHKIDSDGIRVGLHFMNNRFDCADFYSVGLLALLNWYGDDPALKAEDKGAIERAFRGFKFWIDEPGLDAMCYFTENHQILFHVTAYLVGQRWPDWVFTNSGMTGRQQNARARDRIESWIVRRLQGNFSEWDSNAYFALDTFAMLALAEFADSARLRDLATNLLDKIFFLIACQSFRGAHGSTHGRCYVAGLKSARVENTSNLQRIAWGMGILNGETRATGMLALARRYKVADAIQAVGADLPDRLMTLARSTAAYRPHFDMVDGRWDVCTMTIRTPDAMLSAAIDYRPGEMGIQEHLWQASMGPELVVFTTYPGNSQEHGNARPNFWSGSARLPRVAMHENCVICLYRFEPGVGLGFSHAYFPTSMFDEVRISGQWVFARSGNGYIALGGDGDLVLTEHGRHARQELRSQGTSEAWVCAIGRTAEDGSFESFCKKWLKSALEIDGPRVQWTTPDAALSFAWDGPLTVNGQPQNWNDFPHYQNAYTNTPLGADEMLIEKDDRRVTLKLR